MLRGDHELNEIKAGKLPGLAGFRFATESEIVEHFGCKPGYLGPVGTARRSASWPTARSPTWRISSAAPTRKTSTSRGVNWGRDLPEPEQVADLRNVVAGDPSPDGKGTLSIMRGIEVGHVFYLGKKYSEALKATFLDETGKPATLEMGCYGIGVTRIVGAAIEQNHDARGIIWPRAIAPSKW